MRKMGWEMKSQQAVETVHSSITYTRSPRQERLWGKCRWQGVSRPCLCPQLTPDQIRQSISPRKMLCQAIKQVVSYIAMMDMAKLEKTFMIPGGYSGPSLSSSSSLSQRPFPFFRLLRFLLIGGSAVGGLHTVQSGTLCWRISASISPPGTCRWQKRQDAVAKEPWHWSTRWTPASVSKVSIFWV